MRLPDIFATYRKVYFEDKRKEFLRKFERTAVLIWDEFLLYDATEEEQQILLEVMERRVERTTTVVCSQYDPGGWIERLGESAVSDAILNRLLSKSHTIKIDGNISIRKLHAAN